MPLERGALLCRQGPATAGSQRAEAQRTKARPGQRENRMTERFEHPANLPVAPFVNRDIDDAASAPHRDDAHLRTRGSKVIHNHSAIEQPHVVGGESSARSRLDRSFRRRSWVKQALRELAVVGQQERAARCVVKAADRNESRSHRHEVGDRAPSSWVAHGCHYADRLVQEQVGTLLGHHTATPLTSTTSSAPTSRTERGYGSAVDTYEPAAISSSALRLAATPALREIPVKPNTRPHFSLKVLEMRRVMRGGSGPPSGAMDGESEAASSRSGARMRRDERLRGAMSLASRPTT